MNKANQKGGSWSSPHVGLGGRRIGEEDMGNKKAMNAAMNVENQVLTQVF